MPREIREVRYSSYIIPFRGQGENKEYAVLCYSGGYGSIGGRFEDGETDARDVLRRELTEELGEKAAVLADIAIEVPAHEVSRVAPERVAIRGAHVEDHFFFIAQVPADLDLTYCEECKEDVRVVWLPINAMLDEKFTPRPEKREFCRQYIIPMINKM